MSFISRVLSQRIRQGLPAVKALNSEPARTISTVDAAEKEKIQNNKSETSNEQRSDAVLYNRFVYPEFLPDPNPLYRNALRERLERMDMMARRAHIGIPEFYVGSIMAVTYSEPHAPAKTNRFVGICIQRKGTGLRASFLLRNVVDNQGVKVLFDMYDPAIHSIDCLRLEKRLDDELLYLRDAPSEYSTFPFDLDPIILPEGTPVPTNKIKVPLKPPPWLEKYEIKDYKGIQEVKVSEKRQKKADKNAKPWEKYDLMKIYRETIPAEEQKEIFAEVDTQLQDLEIARRRLKRKRGFGAPKKTT